MKYENISLVNWKTATEKSAKEQYRSVRFTEPTREGVIHALWPNANPFIEPTLGAYFTKDLHGKPAGFAWHH